MDENLKEIGSNEFEGGREMVLRRAVYESNNILLSFYDKDKYEDYERFVKVFDLKGKLQQDYGLKLDDKKLNSLEQASDFIYYKNQIALASKKEKDLRLLVGDLDGTLIADTLHTQLSNPEEIVKGESDSNSFARFWYKNIFYVWGYQNIRHISRKAEESSHYVFYLNKIEVY